jgi:hypothetical protein
MMYLFVYRKKTNKDEGCLSEIAASPFIPRSKASFKKALLTFRGLGGRLWCGRDVLAAATSSQHLASYAATRLRGLELYLLPSS